MTNGQGLVLLVAFIVGTAASAILVGKVARDIKAARAAWMQGYRYDTSFVIRDAVWMTAITALSVGFYAYGVCSAAIKLWGGQ